MTGDGKNALHGGVGMFFEPILSNVYRAYGIARRRTTT